MAAPDEIKKDLKTLTKMADKLDDSSGLCPETISGWRSKARKCAFRLFKESHNMTIPQLMEAVRGCASAINSYNDSDRGFAEVGWI